VTFIATSIAIIEMNDIPMAVLNAADKDIWRDKIKVSRAIEVSSPLTMASVMIASVDQAMPLN